MWGKTSDREKKRSARHQRLRRTLRGTSDRPRLCVHRSLKNFTAQIIDDSTGKILLGMTTVSKSFHANAAYGGNVKASALLGESIAKEATQKGIKKVCFDRGGYMYHGRVKAFAEAARKAGLEF